MTGLDVRRYVAINELGRDCSHKDGKTALIMAAQGGHTEAVKALYDNHHLTDRYS